MNTCVKCGQAIGESAKYCTNCGEEIASYPKPAGFWIRVLAQLVDTLVFIPIMILNFVNFFSIKSMPLLLLVGVPWLIYKPFMESFYGATLGKMACGIRVMNAAGEKLSLGTAYVRFLPFLISAIFSLASTLVLFGTLGFESARTFMEIGELQRGFSLRPIKTLLNLFVMVDCVVAGFSFRKRALHDMMAGSFCVYKEPDSSVAIIAEKVVSEAPDESSF